MVFGAVGEELRGDYEFSITNYGGDGQLRMVNYELRGMDFFLILY